MARILSWLREHLKRVSQYAAVFVASIPGGVLYFGLFKFGGVARPVAFVIALVPALVLSYFAWEWLGTFHATSARQPPAHVVLGQGASPIGFTPQQSFGFAGCVIFVIVPLVGGHQHFDVSSATSATPVASRTT